MSLVPSPAAAGALAPASGSLRRSLLALAAGNLLVMGAYALGRVGLAEVLWTYWLQSVAIGVFNVLRIRRLDGFSTEGLTSNGHPVPRTEAAKRSTARFFALHYGAFHVAYFVMLLARYRPEAGAWLWLLPAGIGLLLSERDTFARHRRTDPTWEPNLGTLLFLPYLRVIPMHLSLLAATGVGLLFLPLKLAADVAMLAVDEHLEAKRLTRAASGVAGAGG
jgi:hypothetical protein